MVRGAQVSFDKHVGALATLALKVDVLGEVVDVKLMKRTSRATVIS